MMRRVAISVVLAAAMTLPPAVSHAASKTGTVQLGTQQPVAAVIWGQTCNWQGLTALNGSDSLVFDIAGHGANGSVAWNGPTGSVATIAMTVGFVNAACNSIGSTSDFASPHTFPIPAAARWATILPKCTVPCPNVGVTLTY